MMETWPLITYIYISYILDELLITKIIDSTHFRCLDVDVDVDVTDVTDTNHIDVDVPII